VKAAITAAPIARGGLVNHATSSLASVSK
jgi:hypothetical protein